MKTTTETKSARSPAVAAIVAWMIINAVFFALELTVFNDAADLNNSITLVLMVLSVVGLLSMRKLGAAFATFALTYTFSFNTFNVIYYPQVFVLNGTSAIINGIAVVYLYRSIFANKFR